MSEADDYPAKCAIRWGMGLVEPLLSVTQRVNDDQAMAELGRTNPAWVRIFFAGVLSNLGGTLPDNDSWRGTSARIGRMAVGPNPPSFDGAVGTDWAPWGTWEDSLDVIESVFSSPDVDPEFAALSEGLLPTAHQASHQLTSLAAATHIAVVPEGSNTLCKGDRLAAVSLAG